MDKATSAPKLISLHLLEEITNGFSKQRRLGGGAYGDVYLGEHKDGEKIAVKLLRDVLHVDDEQFEKEYHNLASLHHKHIVRLVGYCNETKREYVQCNGRYVLVEQTKRALCFEYMPNKSLDNFISDESNGHNWCTRYGIIKGICEGLEYLHDKLESPMYHLDLKPANVLLDENMSPKIADFGLSRMFGGDKTKVTKSAIGTHGYVPPEYIDAAVISIKFDIFSLGIVIIKIMTGKDGYFRSAEMSSLQFVELVHRDWMNRLQATSVHPYSIQVRRCIEIALRCVEADRHERPSMGVIVNILKETESVNQILEVLGFNGSESSINQMCPCICDDTTMLNILKNKFISYPLHVTDYKGRVHKATVTTIDDPSGHTSTFEHVRPRIKIIDPGNDLGPMWSIDVHSTEPWILACHYSGNVSILNHQDQTRVMAFDDDSYFVAAKFIEPLWCFVAGDRKGYIHVHSYIKMDKLQRFRAHADWVSSLAVHPSEPFVLSASHDTLVKLWNWEAGWQCIRTFEGHSGSVYQVKFETQTKGNTFASCSGDSTIKIWNIHSPTPVTTLDCGPYEFLCCLDYFTPSGDKQYLVTGSSHGNAQIWDLKTNTCIKRIEGLQRVDDYSNIAVVETVPGRPILLTVSEDHTVALCDSATHRYENRVNFNLGVVVDCLYISKTKSLAIGCQKGVAIMEID